MWSVFLFSLVPFAVIVAGGAVAAFYPISRRVESYVQHFAAGVIFSAVSIELLPPMRAESPYATIIGFAAGIMVVLVIRHLGHKLEGRKGGSGAAGFLIATGADVAVDGLVIGAGFAAGENKGVLLMTAISLEFVFLGVSSAAELRDQGKSALAVVGATAVLGATAVAGAVGGAAGLSNAAPSTMAVVLAFGAVAMMYLVTEELLVHAHRAKEGPGPAAVFFVGFLVYLLISDQLGARG